MLVSVAVKAYYYDFDKLPNDHYYLSEAMTAHPFISPVLTFVTKKVLFN